MPRFLKPITDRTAADLLARNSKAFLNVADWHRIYGNAQLANQLLNSLLDADLDFPESVLPDITSFPSIAEVNELLNALEQMRLESGLPALPGLVELRTDWLAGGSAQAPDYLDLNAWERVIEVLFSSAGLVAENFVYCGVAAAGQPRFYQHRWRQFQWVPDALAPVRRARTGAAKTGTGLKRQNQYRRYA